MVKLSTPSTPFDVRQEGGRRRVIEPLADHARAEAGAASRFEQIARVLPVRQYPDGVVHGLHPAGQRRAGGGRIGYQPVG